MNFQILGIPEISLRHLKAMSLVAQYGNLTRAAEKLNRSQTAITRAIIELERHLNVQLFHRFATGMKPNVYGEILAKRVEKVAAAFECAGRIYLNYKRDRQIQNHPIFSMEISYKRLAAIIALHDTKDITAAAKMLGVTQAAVYNSLRQVEGLLEMPIFERTTFGFSATNFCQEFVRQMKLAFSQLRYALDELASVDGKVSGHLTIGTLPYARTFIIPQVLNQLLSSYPELKVATKEGSYRLLESDLRSGEIDLIVGAIRDSQGLNDLKTERLFEDRLSVIVRSDHPLSNKSPLDFTELLEYPWVLPANNSPSREIFNAWLQKNKLKHPENIVETSSFSTVRGLLLESDRIAWLSEHQIYYEKKHGLLRSLPIELKDSYRPIGVTLRSQTAPSPATKLFMECLRDVTKKVIEER